MAAKKKEETSEFDIFLSGLVPRHELLSGEDKADLLKTLNVAAKQLPRIKEDDPAVKQLQAKKGDVIKIARKSLSAGEYFYYRVVV
ncbi:MAG TPA: DNA-directed RNA polymerase subunit H [archaeon]|nr:DNA-directed RNA polymerase subunit H [archaeon]